MNVEGALALLAETVEALDAAVGELVALREMEDVPLPDGVIEKLAERGALAATLSWLLGQPGVERWRGSAQDRYRAEVAKQHCDEQGVAPPVNDEVVRAGEKMFELLRRQALVDADVDLALRACDLGIGSYVCC